MSPSAFLICGKLKVRRPAPHKHTKIGFRLGFTKAQNFKCYWTQHQKCCFPHQQQGGGKHISSLGIKTCALFYELQNFLLTIKLVLQKSNLVIAVVVWGESQAFLRTSKGHFQWLLTNQAGGLVQGPKHVRFGSAWDHEATCDAGTQTWWPNVPSPNSHLVIS